MPYKDPQKRKKFQREYARKWRKENQERFKELARKSYIKHREKRIAEGKELYKKNREKTKRKCEKCGIKIWGTNGSILCPFCSTIKNHFKVGHKGNLGNKNGMWVGDSVSYGALHAWVTRHFPKPGLCQCCNIKKAHDLSNKGVYGRDLKNWEWLCRKCHMTKDGRLEKFILLNKKAAQ